MADKEKQTKRKQPVVKWVHGVVGLIVLAPGVCVIYVVISAAHAIVETWQWALVVVGILVGLLFAAVGAGQIWDVGQQIRNRNIFSHDAVETQAAMVRYWPETVTGYHAGDSETTYYVKLSFRVASAEIEANPIEIVAEVDQGLYNKLANKKNNFHPVCKRRPIDYCH